MQPPVLEHVFETLGDAIIHAFQQEQTSLLSLDRICEYLHSPSLYLNSKKDGLIPCSSIARRRISSTLSSSELFVRAGPPRTCLWAIRPNNPLFLSDGAISASIEQMLAANGPMTLDAFVHTTQLNGADAVLFARFLADHPAEFALGADGTYWFTNQPRPIYRHFVSISHALAYALGVFKDGASVEELSWFLCMSTVTGQKAISRRSVSRELSRRTDLFDHLARARYTLIENAPIEEPPDRKIPLPLPNVAPDAAEPGASWPFFAASAAVRAESVQSRPAQEDDEFDPFRFFGHEFQFAFE